MGQLDKEHWILKELADTAEKACKKSSKSLKAKQKSDFEEAVTDIRSNYKRIRATLRLVRDETKSYKKENEFFRDEAKRTLDVQKAIAMVHTIDLINEQYSDRLYKNAFTELRDKLVNHKDGQIENAHSEEHTFQEMGQNLEGRCEKLNELLSNPVSYDTIQSGLKRVYKRGRNAQRNLSKSQTDQDFHELQKRANYLRIQLELIEPIWPELLKVWGKELEKLSQLLVTSEGLYQLSDFLRTNSDTDIEKDGTYLMKTLVEGHREQVQQHAQLLAHKIYSLKPKDFLKLIDAAWEAHSKEDTQQMLPSGNLKLNQ